LGGMAGPAGWGTWEPDERQSGDGPERWRRGHRVEWLGEPPVTTARPEPNRRWRGFVRYKGQEVKPAIIVGVNCLILLIVMGCGFYHIIAWGMGVLPPGWAQMLGVVAWIGLGVPAMLMGALLALTMVFFVYDNERARR